MTDDAATLTLEHLKVIKRDLADLKARISVIEPQFASLLLSKTRQSGRIDELDDRLVRIERRLGLTL